MNSPQNHQAIILARGGGGGSSSGGGGGGGGGHSSGSSYSSSSGSGSGSSAPGWVTWLFIFGFVGIWILIMVFSARAKKKSGSSPPTGFVDAKDLENEDQKALASRANDVFMKFQQAWMEFDLTTMKKVTSPSYYAKMVLELNVLKNYQRKNLMENTEILGTYIGQSDSYTDEFRVFFRAKSNDKLIDTKENKEIFKDSSEFTEIWNFVKVGKEYVLDRIDQTTADASKFDEGIAQFASSNNYFYDPDFGWLMMPTRGAIFGPTGFGNADINNHVIGSYGKANKQKIVEFYSYEPKAGMGMSPITVAQAILPKHYDDILVTEKSWYRFKPKGKGLEKVETESVEFNKKFAVWAAKPDRATSFELLATNFMERIYKLDFEVNIEVVDNVLYLYSPDHKPNYAEMQEVLSWAFEEMKL